MFKRLHKTRHLLIVLQLIFWAGCSTGPRAPGPIAELADQKGSLETIVVVGTNDIHGQLAPADLKSREPEGQKPIDYQAGGALYLASYIEILRKEFGSKILWLDAGDEFQGTIESNSEKGKPMVDFFNSAGLNAAAVGNHEFDYGPESDPHDVLGALKARMAQANYPYLSANIQEKATGKAPEFPNLHPNKLFRVGRLTVGVVGLTTLETAHTTLPTNIRALKFAELAPNAIRESQALRNAGAQIVILDGHIGIECKPGRSPVGYSIRKPSDPLGQCDPSYELVKLLKAVPSGTFDAVVSGHSHRLVHHWIAGVPVIQGGASARYFNAMYLTYDLDQKKLLTDKTRIEGPVPVCPKVFKNQNDCNGDRPAPESGRGPLVTPVFHGKEISADPKTQALLDPVFRKSESIKAEVLSQAARPIDHQRFSESALGNLIVDAVREKGNADFALVNSGGIRAHIEQGPITYNALFRALPFDNTVVVLKLTGREVKTILRIAESGARGFHPVSGLQVKLINPAFDAPSSDLDGDRKIEPWEINRLLEVRTSDGEPINDHKMYTFATLDFLVLGGDDMAWIMKQIPEDRINMLGPPAMRDVVAQYLRSSPVWNSTEKPLIDSRNPRITLENAKYKPKRKAHNRAKSRGKAPGRKKKHR